MFLVMISFIHLALADEVVRPQSSDKALFNMYLQKSQQLNPKPVQPPNPGAVRKEVIKKTTPTNSQTTPTAQNIQKSDSAGKISPSGDKPSYQDIRKSHTGETGSRK